MFEVEVAQVPGVPRGVRRVVDRRARDGATRAHSEVGEGGDVLEGHDHELGLQPVVPAERSLVCHRVGRADEGLEVGGRRERTVLVRLILVIDNQRLSARREIGYHDAAY